MEVSEFESMACSKVKAEASPQPPEEPMENHSCSSSNKQNSIFSLTFDEFQYKTGKSFGSMNMDEFLTSVWNVEGNQASSNSNQNEVPSYENVATQMTPTRQGALSIPTPLCNKTVEEVWSGIHKNQQNPHTSNINHEPSQCQQTFGEMTLEDFLIKAGVIQEPSKLSSQQRMTDHFQNHSGNYFPSNSTCLDVNFGTTHLMGFNFSNHSNTGNNLLGNVSSMYQTFTQSGRFVGESSNNIGNGKCSGVSNMGELKSKRRMTNGAFEVAVERRQRRMIKNRESAARSRARKQAYTAELEIELNQLREENTRLKLVLTEVELKRTQEEMKGKQSAKTQLVVEKFKTMRRTSSLAW